MIVENQPQQEIRESKSEVSRILRSSVFGLAGFALIYLFFLGLYLRFPYIRPGDNLVADMKHGTARDGDLFKTARGERLHVMAFGYSKMLAGFNPDVFDSELTSAGIAAESYNFGLPGDSRFVADLEAMAAHGTAPDIALLTFPWPADTPTGPTFFHFIDDDQELMTQLFPFHHLPRNLFILAVQAHGIRQMSKVYKQDEEAVRQVAVDRGYYFISRQSHYPNDELPPDFRRATDQPRSLSPRVVTLGPVYQRLATILATHQITCLFVPSYFRQGEFASPPAINLDTARVLANQPNVQLLGPDYWLYPDKLFSDPTHANRVGASTYTRDLAALVSNWLKRAKSSRP